MALQVINTGILPNDGEGDPLRVAFQKINVNFATVFSSLTASGIDLLPIVIPEGATVTQAFNIINDNFANIYSSLDGNISAVEATMQNIVNIGQVILNPTQINNYTTVMSAPAPTTLMSSLEEPVTQPLQTNYTSQYQELINIGASANDGEGDPLRTAFQKVNNNFTTLFSTASATAESYTLGTTPDQIILSVPAAEFTQGQFHINSSDSGTPDSQNIILKVSLNNAGNNVTWTGYGLTFEGNAITRYDVTLSDGNVNIISNPITSDMLTHFISYQVTWSGPLGGGIEIGLDGYSFGNVMGTESDLILTTE